MCAVRLSLIDQSVLFELIKELALGSVPAAPFQCRPKHAPASVHSQASCDDGLGPPNTVTGRDKNSKTVHDYKHCVLANSWKAKCF